MKLAAYVSMAVAGSWRKCHQNARQTVTHTQLQLRTVSSTVRRKNTRTCQRLCLLRVGDVGKCERFSKQLHQLPLDPGADTTDHKAGLPCLLPRIDVVTCVFAEERGLLGGWGAQHTILSLLCARS